MGLCPEKAGMYKICEKGGEYTMYICKYFTMYMQEFTGKCRIFICVFIVYTVGYAHTMRMYDANGRSYTYAKKTSNAADFAEN